MSKPPTESRPAKEPKDFTPEDLAALNALWAEVALADDDDGIRLRRQLLARVRRLTHAQKHPGCRRVSITIPRDVMGETFKVRNLNGTLSFEGPVEVDECVARELAYMIDRNQRMDRERLQERKIHRELGAVAATAAAIQRET